MAHRENGFESCIGVVLAGLSTLLACACGDVEERPDQVGRYVFILNESGEELCPGTAAQIDDYVDGVFAVLGAEAPDQRFIEYRWDEVSRFGRAQRTATGTRIHSGSAVHEHELVHAAHQYLWPDGPMFLQEGLAVLFGGSAAEGAPYSPYPTGADLDERLAAGDGFEYGMAWLVVSQIVLEHGLEGLREFWFALAPDATMAEVRATYSRMFGKDFETLVQPFELPVLDELHPVERSVCRIRICTGERIAWEENNTIVGVAPTDCSGRDAVSRSDTIDLSVPWRDYFVEGPTPTVGRATPPGVRVEIERCGVLWCEGPTVRDAGLVSAPEETWAREDAYRLRVAVDPEVFDPGAEPTFELVPFL